MWSGHVADQARTQAGSDPDTRRKEGDAVLVMTRPRFNRRAVTACCQCMTARTAALAVLLMIAFVATTLPLEQTMHMLSHVADGNCCLVNVALASVMNCLAQSQNFARLIFGNIARGSSLLTTGAQHAVIPCSGRWQKYSNDLMHEPCEVTGHCMASYRYEVSIWAYTPKSFLYCCTGCFHDIDH